MRCKTCERIELVLESVNNVLEATPDVEIRKENIKKLVNKLLETLRYGVQRREMAKEERNVD